MLAFNSYCALWTNSGDFIRSEEGTNYPRGPFGYVSLWFGADAPHSLGGGLSVVFDLRQMFYADDGQCSGSLQDLRGWMDHIALHGEAYGYVLNPA
jgi:hypothetical protein